MRFKVYVAAASAVVICTNVVEATHSKSHTHSKAKLETEGEGYAEATADSDAGMMTEAPVETET